LKNFSQLCPKPKKTLKTEIQILQQKLDGKMVDAP
jgi:hypothetical protein